MEGACRARGAAFVAFLLPAVGDPRRLDARFAGARAALRDLAIPSLDLVATFADVTDLRALRVSDVDHHPNAAGYELLHAAFVRELVRAPEVAELLTGRPAR
jgi:hypothetical protein